MVTFRVDRGRLGLLVTASLISPLLFLACSSPSSDSTFAGQPDGQSLAESKGCLSCHSTDGSVRVGPTWQGLFGSSVELTDGRTIRADRSYIVRSILNPASDKVRGYTSSMPQLELSTGEALAFADYIKTLN